MKKSIGFLIFITLVLPIYDYRLSYVSMALLGLPCLYWFAVHKQHAFHRFTPAQYFIFLLPALIIISWVYGVFVGIVNGVSVEYVFSNFLGLLFYLVFYILFFSFFNVSNFPRLFFWLALLVTAWALIVFTYSIFKFGWFNDSPKDISSGRVLYDVSFLYVAPFIFVYFISKVPPFDVAASFVSNNRIPSVVLSCFLFLVFSFVLIVPAFSKGFILVYFSMVLAFFCLNFLYALIRGRVTVGFISFILLLFFVIIYFNDYLWVLIDSFSSGEKSNALRSEQYQYLARELSLTGSGLGSSLASGYSRSEGGGYGFELTYVNLVHKLGVFVFPLFASYVVAVLMGLCMLFKAKKRPLGAFILGLMGYLIPGAGNPILLSPNFVLVHSIVLLFLFKELGERNNSECSAFQ